MGKVTIRTGAELLYFTSPADAARYKMALAEMGSPAAEATTSTEALEALLVPLKDSITELSQLVRTAMERPNVDQASKPTDNAARPTLPLPLPLPPPLLLPLPGFLLLQGRGSRRDHEPGPGTGLAGLSFRHENTLTQGLCLPEAEHLIERLGWNATQHALAQNSERSDEELPQPIRATIATLEASPPLIKNSLAELSQCDHTAACTATTSPGDFARILSLTEAAQAPGWDAWPQIYELSYLANIIVQLKAANATLGQEMDQALRAESTRRTLRKTPTPYLCFLEKQVKSWKLKCDALLRPRSPEHRTDNDGNLVHRTTCNNVDHMLGTPGEPHNPSTTSPTTLANRTVRDLNRDPGQQRQQPKRDPGQRRWVWLENWDWLSHPTTGTTEWGGGRWSLQHSGWHLVGISN